MLDDCRCKLHIYLFYSIILLLLSSSTYGKATIPSSCGNISNISCPFRLKGDHQKCDKTPFSYELVCNHNRTTIYLPNDGYYYNVLDIDYRNYTIRVADPGLEKNNCSSRPLHSIQETISFDYYLQYSGIFSESKTLLTFIECPSPIISSRYINITTSTTTKTACNNNDNTSPLELSSREKYFYYNYYYYVVAGYMTLLEVEDGCKVSKTTWVSSFNVTSNTSNFSDIHDGMVYGFHISWADIFCRTCKSANCHVDPFNNYYGCYHYNCSVRHRNSYKVSIYCEYKRD